MHRLKLVEEDAPPRAEGGLAVAEHVPCTADSRSDDVVVPLEHGIAERRRAGDANEAVDRLWTPVSNPPVNLVRHGQEFVAHAEIQRERAAHLVIVLNVAVEEEIFITLVSVGASADRCDSAWRARVHASKSRTQNLQESLQCREGVRSDLR